MKNAWALSGNYLNINPPQNKNIEKKRVMSMGFIPGASDDEFLN